MRPVPGRLENIALGQPFGVFVDYAHTDDALRNVLTTLREITPGRLLLAFGCGGNRDPGKRPKMGIVAAMLANFTIITSDNPRRESPEKIAAAVAAAANRWVARRPRRVRECAPTRGRRNPATCSSHWLGTSSTATIM